ncbi:hypothetical protein AB0M72_18665 [Nocardiopsis dassonvillei]|uniref:hypothetical protein n=1 Tax=Nocardiopsis dassonvillei TaxID=2014 RepID=UPI00200E01C7|nr:hypothetical protein [Nocardiopsis dassonvillei]MCK9871777.1 hypothetical protein [Nocardiopsis dassonvillei]
MFLFPFSLLAFLCLIVMCVVFPVSATRSLVRAGRRVEEGKAWSEAVELGPLIHLSAIAFTAAFVVYGRAHLYYAPSLFPEDTCFLRANTQAPPVSHDAFPLSTVCPSAYEPGGVEIVPAWTNPTIAALVAVAAVILAAAYAVHLRRT